MSYNVCNTVTRDENSGTDAVLLFFTTCSNITWELFIYDSATDIAEFFIPASLLGPAVYGKVIMTEEDAHLVIGEHSHDFLSRGRYTLQRDPCDLTFLFEEDPAFCTAICRALDTLKRHQLSKEEEEEKFIPGFMIAIPL